MCKGIANVDESEIEVTLEMIEAGVGEFYSHDLRFDTVEGIVAEIYRAMDSSRHRRT